jgi:hypothetical protein
MQAAADWLVIVVQMPLEDPAAGGVRDGGEDGVQR